MVTAQNTLNEQSELNESRETEEFDNRVLLPEPNQTKQKSLFKFSHDQYHVNKMESGTARVAVERTGDNTGSASVDYATKDGTATAGSDYILASGTLAFAAGETRKSFTIPIIENSSGDGKTVSLELSSPQGGGLGSPDKAMLTILSTSAVRNSFRDLLTGSLTNPNTIRVVKHISLTVVLIGGIALLSVAALQFAHRSSDDLGKYLTQESVPQLPTQISPTISAHELSRLQDQLKQVWTTSSFHRKVMLFYYERYFMFIITSSLTAAVAAIILVLLSKRGWEATNEYLITAFFIATAAAAFYGSWPGLFKQEDNITDNKLLFLKYRTLEEEILSYVVTGEALNRAMRPDDVVKSLSLRLPAGQQKAAEEQNPPPSPNASNSQQPSPGIGIPMSVKEFIHYIDLQLAQDNVAIGFDYKQAPNYQNAFTKQ